MCVSLRCLVLVDERHSTAVATNATIYIREYFERSTNGITRVLLDESCTCRFAATPAATWPARTKQMTALQHTQPTAARMKSTARHHQ